MTWQRAYVIRRQLTHRELGELMHDYQQIKVVVCDLDFVGLPSKLVDEIGRFQELLEDIPPNYRADAMCEIDGAADFDGGHRATLKVWYHRQESPMEHGQRLAREANKRDAEIAAAQAILRKYGKLGGDV